jgi:hypothetical protein
MERDDLMKKDFKEEERQNPKFPSDTWDNADDIPTSTDVIASTECTGLIPTPPQFASEAESYTDLFSIPKPQGARERLAKSNSSKK